MRVLFVPVSAARGFGEYARARELAHAIQQRWPQVQLHFVLSMQAPYATRCAYPVTLLPGSATLHSAQVVELLKSFNPDIVIFDNAGRTAQVRAAHKLGARVVYISSRRRQRRKAFRLSWMRRLSEHWIAYPEFIAGRLSGLERLKLRMLGRPRLRFIDTLLPVAEAAVAEPLPQARDFILVVPGGGTPHPGAHSAPEVIGAAAEALAARGLPTVLVGVADSGHAAGLTRSPLLPQTQLVNLMRRARLVISNGGDTLLQALACGCACVAVPIAHDQAARIARCCELQLIHTAPLATADIVDAATRLYADDAARAKLIERTRSVGVKDTMPQVLDWIEGLAAGRLR